MMLNTYLSVKFAHRHTQRKAKAQTFTLHFQVQRLFLKALLESSVFKFNKYWKHKLGDSEQQVN